MYSRTLANELSDKPDFLMAPGIGLRQNYCAFEWGDALFVVLDPYKYTPRKPGTDG